MESKFSHKTCDAQGSCRVDWDFLKQKSKDKRSFTRNLQREDSESWSEINLNMKSMDTFLRKRDQKMPAQNFKDPVKIWAELRKEIAGYKKDLARLRQAEKEHKQCVLLLKEEKSEYEPQGHNLKRFNEEIAPLKRKIHELQTVKDGVAKKLVEASAVFDATDKEKKCVKQILTRNWKDDLLNLFFKEKMSHISTDRRILDSNLLEWEYVLKSELSFKEINNLLIKLVQSKQNSTTFKCIQESEKSLQDSSSYLKGPLFMVDMREFLAPPALQDSGHQGLQGSDTTSKKPTMNSLFRDAKTESDISNPKTYEEYLDMMDREIHNSYKIYQKQTDIYNNLTSSGMKHSKEEMKYNRQLTKNMELM